MHSTRRNERSLVGGPNLHVGFPPTMDPTLSHSPSPLSGPSLSGASTFHYPGRDTEHLHLHRGTSLSSSVRRMSHMMDSQASRLRRFSQLPQFDAVRKRRERLNRLINYYWPRVRPFLPYFSLTIYSFLGGIIFYIIENNLKRTFDHRAAVDEKCIGTIHSSFFYSMSACSTIGFGVVYPCTNTGRVTSIPFIMFGIPQLVIVLTDIGKRMCVCMRWMYRSYLVHKHNRKVRRAQKKSFKRGVDLLVEDGPASMQLIDSDSFDESVVDVPISLGISLTLICFCFLSLFYMAAESYPVYESAYGSFLTFMTGDYVVTNFAVAAPCYGIVLVGFAMLSTTIQIVQNNMENLKLRVRRAVDMKLNQMRGEVDAVDSDEVLKDIIKKQSKKAGKFVSNMMSTDVLEQMVGETKSTKQMLALQGELERKNAILSEIRKRRDNAKSVGIQVKPPVSDAASICGALTDDMASDAFLTDSSDRTTQTIKRGNDPDSESDTEPEKSELELLELHTRMFKCAECEEEFGHREALQHHMRTVHARPSPAPLSGSSLSLRSLLSRGGRDRSHEGSSGPRRSTREETVEPWEEAAGSSEQIRERHTTEPSEGTEEQGEGMTQEEAEPSDRTE